MLLVFILSSYLFMMANVSVDYLINIYFLNCNARMKRRVTLLFQIKIIYFARRKFHHFTSDSRRNVLRFEEI